MGKRFVAIWLRYLQTDWLVRRHHHLKGVPLVVKAQDHGRMVIIAANALAREQGIDSGMVLADARAVVPNLASVDDEPGLIERLLTNLANWCIYFTPTVAIDPTGGLMMDVSGCAHLWGGEEAYLKEIRARFTQLGYDVQVAMADTIGTAWAFSRYGKGDTIIDKAAQATAIQYLPAASLRLENEVVEKLQKLGLYQVKDFIHMPRTALRRRFGTNILQRLDQTLGNIDEPIVAVNPPAEYAERLPCIDLISTATGIRIALEKLLNRLCNQLQKQQKGLREVIFKCYRADYQVQEKRVETIRPGNNPSHLFKLFEEMISSIAPGPGIELFILEAVKVESVVVANTNMWAGSCTLQSQALSELIDRLATRVGSSSVKIYKPSEEYLPERSFKPAALQDDEPAENWRCNRPRPMLLLHQPEPVDVMAPVPDYPPMLFQYRKKRHKIVKADGPERIEQQWWLQRGEHRDYYYVEDEEGCRYWLFRSGHYALDKKHQWFLHGFFV